MIIVLMGYMGSGKSTVGVDLADILSFEFVDLDEFISDKEQLEITDIFKTKGEIYFRRKESLYLSQLLGVKSNIVLSLGGGTPCYGNNLELVLNSAKVKSFYLKASIRELSKRLMPEKKSRPLISHLNDEEEFFEFLGKHLFERSQYYSKSDFTINTDGKSIKNIVEDIVLKLV